MLDGFAGFGREVRLTEGQHVGEEEPLCSPEIGGEGWLCGFAEGGR